MRVVGAISEASEQILATAVGDSAVEQNGACGIGEEVHHHKGEAGFTRVLRGIAIRIGENGVANGAGVIHAEVEVFQLIARSNAEEEGNRGGPRG